MELDQLLEDNKARLNFYAPYKCFRETISAQRVKICEQEIRSLWERGDFAEVSNTFFFFEELEWDSRFFGRTVFRLRYVLARGDLEFQTTAAAARLFLDQLAIRHPAAEVWTAVPSEDAQYLQALNAAGFRLIETRLRYFKTDLQEFNGARAKVRLATPEDAPALRELASQTSKPIG